MIRRARDMLAGLRERRARHRKRSVLYRVIFATAGFCVVTGGILLLVLPGPGLVVIAVGLGMLALEFDRAERLLELILERIDRAASSAAKAGPLAKALGVLAAVLGVVGGVVPVLMWDIPYLPGQGRLVFDSTFGRR